MGKTRGGALTTPARGGGGEGAHAERNSREAEKASIAAWAAPAAQ